MPPVELWLLLLGFLLAASDMAVGESEKEEAGGDLSGDRNATVVFLDWLRHNNVTEVFPPHNKLSIYLPDVQADDRALFTVSPFEFGDVMVTIPYSIAFELQENDPRPYHGADWQVALAAKLLRELALGDKSPWKPYLDTFPQHHLIPWMDLHQDQLFEVQYEPTIRRIRDLQSEAAEAYEACEPEAIAYASWEAFGWALTMVWNHAFALFVPRSEGSLEGSWRYMFLPIADLLNHHVEPNTDWRGVGVFSDRVELLAQGHIPIGSAALADYGDLTTEAMFVFYGLVTASNPRDSTVLFYSLAEAVEWYIKRFHKAFRGKKRAIPEDAFEHFIEAAKEGAAKQLQSVGRADLANRLNAVGSDYIDPHDNTHGEALVLYPNGVVDSRLIGAFAMLERETHGGPWTADESDWEVEVEDAFVSVSRRCLEILESFKTTITMDKKTINVGRRKQEAECAGEHCGHVGALNGLIDLTIQYRMVKKMYLEELVLEFASDYDHDEL